METKVYPFLDEILKPEGKPDCGATERFERRIPFLSEIIKQEIKSDCDELTVKSETNDDEEEVHVYPVRNKMESSCTSSTCPVVEENLLSCEELKQETLEDCHQSLTPVGNCETDYGDSCTNIQTWNTVSLRMPVIEKEKQQGSCRHDEEIQSGHLCQLSFLQCNILDDHVKMSSDKSYCKLNEHCNLQQILRQGMRNNVKESTSGQDNCSFVEAVIEDKTKSRLAGLRKSVNFIICENIATNICRTDYKMPLPASTCGNDKVALSTCISETDYKVSLPRNDSETDYKIALLNEDSSRDSIKILSDSERNAKLNMKEFYNKPHNSSRTQTYNTQKEEEPYKYDVEFAKNIDLQRHDRIFAEEQDFSIGIHGTSFMCESRLQKNDKTPAELSLLKCSVCSLRFTFKKDLWKHAKIHTGEKPYKCDLCGLRCTWKGHLHRHIRAHTGEKPYKCDDCGKGFARKGDLQCHKRMHTGEKPYKCEVCGVEFAHKGNLQMHERTHSEEKLYTCDVCGVRFTWKNCCQRHKRTHMGEKPYKCDDCGVGFARKGHLQRHKRIHTGEKPYTCSVCSVGFARKEILQYHKRMHHPCVTGARMGSKK